METDVKTCNRYFRAVIISIKACCYKRSYFKYFVFFFKTNNFCMPLNAREYGIMFPNITSIQVTISPFYLRACDLSRAIRRHQETRFDGDSSVRSKIVQKWWSKGSPSSVSFVSASGKQSTLSLKNFTFFKNLDGFKLKLTKFQNLILRSHLGIVC